MQCEEAVYLAALLCVHRLWLFWVAATMYPAQHQVSLMLYCASCTTHSSTHRWRAHLQTLSEAGLWQLH